MVAHGARNCTAASVPRLRHSPLKTPVPAAPPSLRTPLCAPVQAQLRHAYIPNTLVCVTPPLSCRAPLMCPCLCSVRPALCRAVPCAVLRQGLSEPLGAFLALATLRPFITEDRLHYLLAFVGGIMVRRGATRGGGQGVCVWGSGHARGQELGLLLQPVCTPQQGVERWGIR